jgi:hypothetical protein
MRIGKHPHLRRHCGSAANPGDQPINHSACRERARFDRQFDTICKASEAGCETCRGLSDETAECHFVTERCSGASCWHGENANWHGR